MKDSEKISAILKETHKFCNQKCELEDRCLRDDCIVFRIQKIIRSK